MGDEPALIVGLGNPGSKYDGTRHNIGFDVVDILARRWKVAIKGARGVSALTGDAHRDGRKVFLAKPTTYMNLSGDAVRELGRYYKVPPEQIVVVHDDLDLPLGTLRVKRGGGDGGHNGLKHITKALGTPNYTRVRLGIGRPSGRMAVVDYVLHGFAKTEQDDAAIMIETGADAVEQVVDNGIEAAQQHFHASEPTSAEPPRAITLERTVRAPIEDVWAAWTTVEGVTSFFAPAARIDLRKGGAYEMLFDADQAEGDQGSEGCKLLVVREPDLLVFSWNAPPSIPDIRAKRTRVEVRLSSVGVDTHVTLSHTGWREGASWDEAFAYFTRAWVVVMDRLGARFVTGPVSWG